MQTTSRRLADKKVAKFQKNITKRGAVPETTVKKGNDYPVGPIVLGFFVFVVIGSCKFILLHSFFHPPPPQNFVMVLFLSWNYYKNREYKDLLVGYLTNICLRFLVVAFAPLFFISNSDKVKVPVLQWDLFRYWKVNRVHPVQQLLSCITVLMLHEYIIGRFW